MLSTLQTNQTEIIGNVVHVASLAPSAENQQPWAFFTKQQELTICLDTNRLLPSDVGEMLSYTGIGACLENAMIGAREASYEPTITFRDVCEQQCSDARFRPIASLKFDQAGDPDPLYSQISERCTSRRMRLDMIPGKLLATLAEEVNNFEEVRCDWITDKASMREIGRLVGMGNRIRFEHRPFHQEFYHSMRLSDEHAQATCDGLDVATLQLPVGVAKLLAYLRSWPRMRLANALGFSRGVARQAAAEVHGSGALGVLTVDSVSAENFIAGGRALQRIWLAVTQAGLGFHPAAALGVFMAHIALEDGAHLQPRHRQMAQQMTKRFFQLFPSDRTLQMVFRIGYAPRPPVRSLRKLPLVIRHD